MSMKMQKPKGGMDEYQKRLAEPLFFIQFILRNRQQTCGMLKLTNNKVSA